MYVIFNNLAANCTPPESPKLHFFLFESTVLFYINWFTTHWDNARWQPMGRFENRKQKTVGFWFLEYLVSRMHLFSFDFDDIFTYICFIRCTFCIYVSIKMLKVEKISTTTNKRKCTCISYMYTHSYDIKYLFDRLKTKRNTKSSNFLANDASFSLILNVIWIFFFAHKIAVKCKKKLHFEM